jgi:hypothetical protein
MDRCGRLIEVDTLVVDSRAGGTTTSSPGGTTSLNSPGAEVVVDWQGDVVALFGIGGSSGSLGEATVTGACRFRALCFGKEDG